MQREAAIKRLTRQEKEKLVESRGMKAVSQETANDMD